jgi:hypothetical protein
MLIRLDPQTALNLFLGSWSALCLLCLIRYGRMTPDARRKLQPYIAAGAGAVVLLFAYLRSGKAGFFLALIPVALIISLNIATVKICPRCRWSNRSPRILPDAQYCGRCGAGLDASLEQA